jgi:hypothetical protein
MQKVLDLVNDTNCENSKLRNNFSIRQQDLALQTQEILQPNAITELDFEVGVSNSYLIL